MTIVNNDQEFRGFVSSFLRATLDEPTFTAGFTEGWEMTEEGAISLAGEIVRHYPS